MILNKLIKGVEFRGLINNQPVIMYPGEKVSIGSISLPAEPVGSLVVEGNALWKNRYRPNVSVYKDGSFVPFKARFKNFIYMSEDEILSGERINEIYRVSIKEKGDEYLIDLDETGLTDNYYILKKMGDLLSFMSQDSKSMLFCKKTGERLWLYNEVNKNLQINYRCIPVVGDVVVIISVEFGAAKRVQGFNVRTGEKLWEVPNAGKTCLSTFFEGEDHLLYGCHTEELDYDKPSRLMLTVLNPVNGDIENVQVGEACDVMAHRVAMYGRLLYYSDNRRGNEVGVIDVDKHTVIDRVSLLPKTKKAVVTLYPPVVTDDRVYVYGQNMCLWVFEK